MSGIPTTAITKKERERKGYAVFIKMPCLQTKAVVTLNSFMKPQMLLLADLHFLSKRRLTRISQPPGSIYASATRFRFVLSSRQKSQIAESP